MGTGQTTQTIRNSPAITIFDCYHRLSHSFFDTRVLKQITHHLGKNNKRGVAYSGGPDSVFLLLHCLYAVDRLGRSYEDIVVLHYMHHIRHDDSIDFKFLQEHFDELPVWSIASYTGSDSRESVLRKHRRDWLRQCQMMFGLQGILTGHHLNDRIETSLLNAIRGCGKSGRQGITQTKTIKRPLLHLEKLVLKERLDEVQCPYLQDMTNLQHGSSERNRLRALCLSSTKKNGIYSSDRWQRMYGILESSDEVLIQRYPCTLHPQWGQGVLIRLIRKTPPSLEGITKKLGQTIAHSASESSTWRQFLSGDAGQYFQMGSGWIMKRGEKYWYTTLMINFWKQSNFGHYEGVPTRSHTPQGFDTSGYSNPVEDIFYSMYCEKELQVNQ